MNKRILILFGLIAISLQGLLAQCYVINDLVERKIDLNGTATYETNGKPAKTLTFDYIGNTTIFGPGIGDLQVYQFVNDSWVNVKNVSASKSYQTATVELDRNATKIEFRNPSPNTLGRWVKNVKVTQATFVESTPNPINCGSLEVLQSSTDTKFSVNWSDVKPLTLSIDNTTDFALSTTSIASSTCAYGTESDIISTSTHKPKATKPQP